MCVFMCVYICVDYVRCFLYETGLCKLFLNVKMKELCNNSSLKIYSCY